MYNCKDEVNKALEKAANICENNEMSWADDVWNRAVKDCAKKVRALIEHDAPSAPIEAEQSGKDEALNMAIEAINMHRARYDNLVNAITNAIEIGNKPLIPSTQSPKESEG